MPDDPLRVLYEYMLSPSNHLSKGANSASHNDAQPFSTNKIDTPIVRPTASSSLELLQFVEATYKKLGKNIVQPLSPLTTSTRVLVPSNEALNVKLDQEAADSHNGVVGPSAPSSAQYIDYVHKDSSGIGVHRSGDDG